jgi:hypothetical protein
MFIVGVFVLFISLHLQSPRWWVAVIVVVLNTFKGTLWSTLHIEFLSLSLSLSVCLSVWYTQAVRLAANTPQP